MHEQNSFLLQNQANPFPIQGTLRIADDGRLSFTLAGNATNLGWLEKHTGGDLKQALHDGQRPVVFDFPVDGVKVKWPKTLGGYAMKVEGPDRTWVVSLNNPNGGALWQTINMVNARKTTKPWKQALEEAGADQ